MYKLRQAQIDRIAKRKREALKVEVVRITHYSGRDITKNAWDNYVRYVGACLSAAETYNRFGTRYRGGYA